MIRALITRPVEDAKPLAEALSQRGIEPVIEPLLTIKPSSAALPSLDGVRALLFTSTNGVRAFAERSSRRDLGVFAVGAATADAARAAGFSAVESADGDSPALAVLVAEMLKPEDGTLVHVAGSVAAGDLAGDLRGRGYTVERVTLYDAEPAQALTPRVIDDLKAGRIDWVLLFSPRTAATFARLVRGAGVEAALNRCTAVCLSAPVAEAAQPLPWRQVRIASQPNQASLLTVIDTLKTEAVGSGATAARAPAARTPIIPAIIAAAATVVVLAAALASTAPLWRDLVLPSHPAASSPPPDTARLEALGARVEQLQRAVDAPRPAQAADPAAAQRVTDLDRRLQQLTGELEGLRGRLSSLNQPEGADKQEVASLGERTGKLAEQIAGLNQRVDQAEQSQKRAATDSSRQAAFAVGVAELDSAARAGRPFAASLRAVGGLAHDPALDELLKPLAPLAEHGAPTPERLKRDYADAARRAKAAQVAAQYDGWMGRVIAFVEGAVTIRRIGADVPGDDAEAVLARAGARLDADDLAGAVAALEKLPEPAARTMAPWLEQARARLALEGALKRLTERALAPSALTGSPRP